MVGFIRDDDEDEDDIRTQPWSDLTILLNQYDHARLRVEELRDELERVVDCFHTVSSMAEKEEGQARYEGRAEDARLWRILMRDSRAAYTMTYGMWSKTRGD